MILNLSDEFKRTLNAVDWMDAESKRTAIEKV